MNTNRRLGFQRLEPRRLMAGPSAIEQEYLQRINRMRTDPQGEYDRLITQTTPQLKSRGEPSIQFNLDFFQTDGKTLRTQWNSLSPVPPLAWDARLASAAKGHTLRMIAENVQAHQVGNEPPLGERLKNAKYPFRNAAESIFAFCESIEFCHAGLAIDWGNGPKGIQNPPVHRENIMNDVFKEIGISVRQTNRSRNGDVGPLVATKDFGTRREVPVRIVGAIYRDNNGSEWYDAGEGRPNVTISFVRTDGAQTTHSVKSMTAGGYQIDLPPGTYEATVTAAGRQFIRGGLSVDQQNVWHNVDLARPDPKPPIARNESTSVTSLDPTLLDVLANDVAASGRLNGASLHVEETKTEAGDWEAVGGKLQFSPKEGVSGFFENRYRVADASGAVSDWAVVRVMVVTPGPLIWQNPVNVVDVDGDGDVVPLDALLIINELNRRGTGTTLPRVPGKNGLLRFVDVTGDGILQPLDALRVINVLNRRNRIGQGEAVESNLGFADWGDLETLRLRHQRP